MSRNSRVLLVVLAILLVVGAGGAFLAIRDTIKNGSKAMSNKTACDQLTLEEAKTLLNETAQKSTSSDINNQDSPDLKTTHCNYVTEGQGLHDIWTVQLELRVAKNDAGAEKNASYFPPNKTQGQQVAGYGDEALWDAYSGQLSVLQDDDFYLVSMSKGLGGNTVTLADVQKAAEAVGLKE